MQLTCDTAHTGRAAHAKAARYKDCRGRTFRRQGQPGRAPHTERAGASPCTAPFAQPSLFFAWLSQAVGGGHISESVAGVKPEGSSPEVAQEQHIEWPARQCARLLE